jgi:hypothetical protein
LKLFQNLGNLGNYANLIHFLAISTLILKQLLSTLLVSQPSTLSKPPSYQVTYLAIFFKFYKNFYIFFKLIQNLGNLANYLNLIHFLAISTLILK